MAIFKGTIAGSISGSIAGVTFSHNKGGGYIRARSIPTNPNSPQQQQVRGFLSQLSNLWVTWLTPAQRAGWEDYAANVTVINALGDPGYLPPLAHYIRSNVPRLQAGLARVDDAPVIFDLGEYTPPTFVVDAADDTVDVGFDNTDVWAGTAGAAMLIWGARQVAASINYFKGPYRYVGKIAGAGTPPTSPANLDLVFPLDEGNRVFLKAQVTQDDGRYSPPFRDFADAPVTP
jgi:hypothetical protein